METKPFKEMSSSPSDCRRYEIREDQVGIEIRGDQIREDQIRGQIRDDGLVRYHRLEDAISE
jgi:hypothetical protein